MEIEEPGELPLHRHPLARESYEVLSGLVEVYHDGGWSELTAGEKHTVPAGAVHSFRTEGPAELINVHEPALRVEEYFRRFHALKTERGVEMPPRGIKAMILLSMLQVEYEPELISIRPPQWLFRALAGLGRLLRLEIPAQ